MPVLVSFVIPAYNASSTIIRCLDSIYHLPFKEEEFETLVIDDCSSDNTVDLLYEYQKAHSNMTLICQQHNHRQGAARNIGVEKAVGDFVVFVDSDDEVSEGLLKALKMAGDNCLDMVAMRVARVQNGKVESEISLPYQEERVFSGVELQKEYPFWFTGPVAYVYRKSFIQQVNYCFAEDVLFEDSDFVNVHLYHAKRMSYCNDCGYRAHYNPDSTTHTISYKHLADYALLGTRMLTFFESLPEKTTDYADSILEGGSYNIMKSFRKVFRLKSWKDIRYLYDRFDSHYDRMRLLCYRKPAYCWTRWTRFCLKHRRMTTFLVGCVLPISRKVVK